MVASGLERYGVVSTCVGDGERKKEGFVRVVRTFEVQFSYLAFRCGRYVVGLAYVSNGNTPTNGADFGYQCLGTVVHVGLGMVRGGVVCGEAVGHVFVVAVDVYLFEV
jgi:hypothetical protein